LSLACEIGLGKRGRSPHSLPRATRELPCCGRRAFHDGRDLVKGHIEHIVQHKRDPLGGSQCFEHDEHRKTDRVG